MSLGTTVSSLSTIDAAGSDRLVSIDHSSLALCFFSSTASSDSVSSRTGEQGSDAVNNADWASSGVATGEALTSTSTTCESKGTSSGDLDDDKR